ncbi:MAG TPA: transferase [Ancylobacter sp.]
MLHVASVKGSLAQAGQQARDSGVVAIDDISRTQGYPRRATDSASVALLMTQHLDVAQPRTDSEALRILRQAFPAAPLAARVAAMASRAR